MRAKIDFMDVPSTIPANSVVIRDVGHKDGWPSVTNDAEAVVKTVLRVVVKTGEPIGPNMPPIYYYDSDWQLGQLEHDGAGFTGFKTHGRD